MLVLIDQGKIEVPVAMSDSDLDLCEIESRPVCTRKGARTAFSTSFGFESHVPRPIWGNLAPVERGRNFLRDIWVKRCQSDKEITPGCILVTRGPHHRV